MVVFCGCRVRKSRFLSELYSTSMALAAAFLTKIAIERMPELVCDPAERFLQSRTLHPLEAHCTYLDAQQNCAQELEATANALTIAAFFTAKATGLLATSKKGNKQHIRNAAIQTFVASAATHLYMEWFSPECGSLKVTECLGSGNIGVSESLQHQQRECSDESASLQAWVFTKLGIGSSLASTFFW